MSFYKNNLLVLRPKKPTIDLPHNPNKLVLVYDTNKEPENNSISVPLNSTVSCNIDWGDGSSDNYNTTGFKTHTYTNPGIYVVQISGAMSQLNYGTTSNTANNKKKLIACLSFGNISLTNLTNAFYNCTNFIQCPSILPSNTIILSGTFNGCSSFNDPNIINWNTSNVTTMTQLFANATVFNQPIGSWNTSKVTSMNGLFFGASSFNKSLNNWDIRQVVGMASMFNGSSWGTTNYDAVLIAWSQLVSPKSNVTFDVGANKYSSASIGARNILINNYRWKINDGGLV